MRWRVAVMLLLLPLLMAAGCVSRPAPEPAVVRDGAPPWEAPRDAVSYIKEAGLAELPLDSRDDPWITRLDVTVSGSAVEVPGFIGIDRLRAVQAPVHTHDSSGDVWLEGQGNRDVTLGQFFVLWGVRFDGTCLGDACGALTVTADGKPVEDPVSLKLRGIEAVRVSVHHR